MNSDANDLHAQLRRQLFMQFLLLAGLAGGVWWWSGGQAALGAAFGFGINMVNGLLILWHRWRAERSAPDDAGRSVRILFRCAMERFVATAALFAIGFGRLDLPPLPLLGGFILGLLGDTAQRFKSK